MRKFFEGLPRTWKRFILLSVDLVFVPVALLVAFCLEFKSMWPGDDLVAVWQIFPTTIGVAAIVSVGLGIPSIRLNAYESYAILRTGVFATSVAMLIAAISIITRSGVPFSVFVVFAFLFFGLSVSVRVIGLQFLLWVYRRGQEQTRVLVYGAGATGVQLIAAIGQSEEIKPVGFLDDNKTLQGMMVAGLPVFAPSRVQGLIVRRHIKWDIRAV